MSRLTQSEPIYDLLWRDILRIAVAADVDPRTVERYFDGRPVRPTNHRKITRAIKRDPSLVRIPR